MPTPFTSPEGRFVQGWFPLKQKKDKDNKPVFDKEGKPVMQSFIALAVRKDNPELNDFYARYVAQAKASFPAMFDANGNCVNSNFAWKIQDGDGRDQAGKSVADKPGFAGCYIFKFATQFPPSVWARDSNNILVQLTEPEKLVKLGYRIRVSGNLDGNKVAPGGTAKSGLYASPEMVLFCGLDEEIAQGGDPNEAFGNLPSQAGLATGLPASGGLPNLGGPQLGAGAPSGLPGLGVGAGPSLGGGGPQLGGLGAPAGGLLGGPPQGGGLLGGPPVHQTPQFTMMPSAQGATREQLHAANWTDEALIAGGHMVKNW